MTKEQAIKILKADETDDSFDWSELGLKGTEDFNRAWDEAYDMAIKALEQEPCKDCISREKAIKEFQVYREYSSNRTNNDWVDRIEKVLECLPPITPESMRLWIPVSERLPKDGTWNIFTDGKNISVERYKMDAIDHFYPEGRWFNFENAIAWLPLPEQYKEDFNRTRPSLYADQDTLMPAT